jgi:uncharacterized protein (DUF2141 family)
MKRTAMTATLLALAATQASAAELTVNITDLRTREGALLVAVVDSAAAWDDSRQAIARQRVVPDGDALTLRFPGLADGAYAVQVMHDENGNGKLDANFLGMPVEGYGFSNNPQVMRRPTYDEARFELAGDASIDVRLR